MTAINEDHSPAFRRASPEPGWIGLTFPRKCGGAGRSIGDRYLVGEGLLGAGAPVAVHWFAVRQVGPAPLGHGAEEPKYPSLPGICRGEPYFAFGLSEPDSGSDLAAVNLLDEVYRYHEIDTDSVVLAALDFHQ